MSALERKVEEKYDGSKIRDFLRDELELSTRLIRRAAIEGRILINNESVRMRHTIHTGDTVTVKLEREESQNIEPEDIPITAVYEDEDIIVVNKQPNIVVHPTLRHPTGTLANGLTNYFRQTGQNCIVRLVSRLDRDTSGLIIIAKNQFAHMALSKEMQKKNLEKRYLAIVHGHLDEMEGTIDAPIYKPEVEGSVKRVVDERGQRSVTHYKVVERFEKGDLVECLLETGRTHQIRVHMNHIGHPIYGDSLYGFGDEEKDLIERQALHAYGLVFESPRTKEKLTLRADMPEDMMELITKLK